jgi:amidase
MARGTRVAYCRDVAGIGVEEGIEQVCRVAALELAQAGAHVEEVELDLAYARPAFLALRGLWFVAQLYGRLHLQDRFGPNVASNLRAGLGVTTRELGAAEAARGDVWRAFRALFERFDAVLTPCMAVPPFPVERNYPETIAGRPMETYVDWIAPTFVLSLTGLPVACVPCGLDGEGLPVGLQVVAPPMGEEAALALAATLQAARPIGPPPALR